MQTLVYFMKRLFILKKLQYGARFRQMELLVHFFFENEAENAVTVNSERYVAMIHNFLTPQLADFPVNENTLFQQDGATSHSARISMNAVNALFPGRVISRNGDITWPPHSPI